MLESIGEALRTARESRRMTIREISKETNMASNYIEALENENFEVFPGETYVIGFLRSYAEYLKLDAEEMIRLYKGYKISESDTPLEELTRPTRTMFNFDFPGLTANNKKMLLIAAGALAVIVIAVFFFKSKSVNIDLSGDDSITKIKDDYNQEKSNKEFEKIQNLKFTGNKGFVLVYKDEAVQFLVDAKELIFVLRELSPTTATIEMLPDKKKHVLEVDKPIDIKFLDTSNPVEVTLKGSTENRAKIMVALKGVASELDGESDKPVQTTTEISPEKTDTTKVQATSEKNLKIVFEAEFTSKTYIELYLDGQQRTRGVVSAGTIERWEANEYIQIKIGNAGGLKAKINGKDYTFGLPGQVANKVITWNKDINDPNIYHIVVKDW